ncbi:MAG: HEPN domain-containing protein [Methanopyri archaeon]|nr:HEPN domain-containing protein [Methanopyri archaeon]
MSARKLRDRFLKRARDSLAASRVMMKEGSPDLALLLVGLAMEFRLRAAHALVGEDPGPEPEIRDLMVSLAEAVGDERILEFAERRSEILDLLEVAYTGCKCGDWEPSLRTVEKALEAAQELFELLANVEAEVVGSSD